MWFDFFLFFVLLSFAFGEAILNDADVDVITVDPYPGFSYARTASTIFPNPICNTGVSYLTMNTGAWCAHLVDNAQWYQMDLLAVMPVYGVATKGRFDIDQWVTSFRVEYSEDNVNFRRVNDGHIFQGNRDRNTVVNNRFPFHVMARYVRILPVTWQGHISIRAGVILERAVAQGMNQAYCEISGDPHNTDFLGRKYDYMGVGDFLLADINGYQVTAQYYNCNGAITCLKYISLATPNGRIIEFGMEIQGINYAKTLDCNKPLVVPSTIDGVQITSQEANKYLLSGPSFMMKFDVHKNAINAFIYVKGHVPNNLIKGGMCVGFPKNNKLEWPGINIPGQAPALGNTNVLGGSWQMDMYHSNICLAKKASGIKTQGSAEKYLRAIKREKKEYTPATRHSAEECCKPIKDAERRCGFAPEIYEGCVMDHMELAPVNGVAQCQKLDFTDECNRRPRSAFVPACEGEWLPATQCFIKDNKCVSSRTYKIIHPQAEGGLKCQNKDGEVQYQRCGIDFCVTKFDVPNNQRAASSYINSGTKDSTLASADSWIPLKNEVGEWVEINLLRIVKVFGVVTKGRNGHPTWNNWVTKYKVSVSDGGLVWNPVKFENGKFEVKGNTDKHTPVTRSFDVPVETKYVRIYPLTYVGYMSVRFAVLVEQSSFQKLTERTCVSVGDPHYTDFTGRKMDYFGKNDYLLAEFDGIRIETFNVPWCGGVPTVQESVTIITRHGQSIEIGIKDNTLNCNPIEIPITGKIIDGVRIIPQFHEFKDRHHYKVQFDKGVLIVDVIHDRTGYINLELAVFGEPDGCNITGGICTGQPFGTRQVGPGGKVGWPGISWTGIQPPAKDINEIGISWEIEPAKSHICRTIQLLNQGKDAYNRFLKSEKSESTTFPVTSSIRKQAEDCCKPVKDNIDKCRWNQDVLRGCILDHISSYQKDKMIRCQSLSWMQDLCNRHQGSLEVPPCIGNWGMWSGCKTENGKCQRGRRYKIVRPAEHNGQACVAEEGEMQYELCEAESCLFQPKPFTLNDPKISDRASSTVRDVRSVDASMDSINGITLENLPRQWTQIDMRFPLPIYGVATKGRKDADEWVTLFEVWSSLDNQLWTPVKSSRGDYEFLGNRDRDTIVNNYFDALVESRFFRIVPKVWSGGNALRWGVLMDQTIADILIKIPQCDKK